MNIKGCNMQVYWIHNEEHTDPYTQGYIGISSNVSKRLQHHSKWHCENKNLKEYYVNGGNIHTILFTGTKEECIKHEKLLRPENGIGWNIYRGGVIPPDCTGRIHSNETKEKISKSNIGKNLGQISPFKGMTNRWTDEQKVLIGSYHKGKTISKAHKQAIRDKLSRDKSPVASHINVYHTDKPDVLVDTFNCIMDFCDKYNIGYSAARSRLRRITQLGRETYLSKVVKPHYFITYIDQN